MKDIFTKICCGYLLLSIENQTCKYIYLVDGSSIMEFQRAHLKRESQEKVNTAIIAINAYACYFARDLHSQYRIQADWRLLPEMELKNCLQV